MSNGKAESTFTSRRVPISTYERIFSDAPETTYLSSGMKKGHTCVNDGVGVQIYNEITSA